MKTLVLTWDGFAAASSASPELLHLHFTPGIPGAWTDLLANTEHIRYGCFDAQDLLRPGVFRRGAELAIERIVFARGIERVLVTDPRCEAIARAGCMRHSGVVVEVAR